MELETTWWRHNDVAQDEILAYVPKLYGLVAQPGLFESLASAANDSQPKNDQPAAFLVKHLPNLLSNASFSLAQMGAQEKQRQFTDVPTLLGEGKLVNKGGDWKPPPGDDPYIRFASHHGVMLSPKNKSGLIYQLTIGYKNHFYKSLVEKEGFQGSMTYGKIVARVGVFQKWADGNFFGGQIQLDFGELHKGGLYKDVIPTLPWKQTALTLRYAKQKNFTAKNIGGYDAKYLTTSQLGTGFQRNFPKPYNFTVKDVWADLLNTFDAAPNPKKTWGGFNMNVMLRIGMDRKADWLNKFFVFSKMRYAPAAERGWPDIRIRAFMK
jgi:hypothetical protein